MKRERSASSLASVHESQNTLADGGSHIASSSTSIALKEEESQADEGALVNLLTPFQL